MLERIYEYLKKKYSNYGNIYFEDRYSYRRCEDLHTLKLENDDATIEWYVYSDTPTEIFIAESIEFKKVPDSGGKKFYSNRFEILECTEDKIDELIRLAFGDTVPLFIKTEIKPIVNVKKPEIKQKNLFNTAVLKPPAALQTAIPGKSKLKKLF